LVERKSNQGERKKAHKPVFFGGGGKYLRKDVNLTYLNIEATTRRGGYLGQREFPKKGREGAITG